MFPSEVEAAMLSAAMSAGSSRVEVRRSYVASASDLSAGEVERLRMFGTLLRMGCPECVNVVVVPDATISSDWVVI